MKLKKVLALILAFAMVLSTMSFTVFAAETKVSTAEDFYNAVKNASSGDVINLGADIEYDVWNSIWNKDGLTINGNGHTITVNAVDSGINGGGMFLKASNLIINDLNVVLPSNATGEMERLATMKSGTLNNVSVTGGTHAVSIIGEGSVIIDNCDFSNINGWAIENENRSTSEDASLTISNSIFDENAVIIRGKNNTFTDNKITNTGEGVNVLGDAVISGNDFGESTLGIDRGVTVTVEKNVINNVEFSSWLDGDYSEVTVTSNTLSDAAVGAFHENVGKEIVSVPVVAKVNGKSYYSLIEAFAGATADEKGDVTYEIYGKATLDKTGWISPRGTSGATTINFVGMTEDAEISITSNKPNATIIATDGVSDMVAINYEDLTLSRPNGSWANDYGHANNYFTTWMRGAANAVVTYDNCVFPNGSCNNQYNKTVYTNCTFNNSTEYALWIYGGEVEVTGSTFEAEKGVKIYTEGATAQVTTAISNSTFDIASKPAIVSSAAGTVTLTNIDAAACQYGLLSTEYKDHNASYELAEVTVDGEAPEYVAFVNGELHTSLAYAQLENRGPIETPVASIFANGKTTYYTSLADAIAEANGGTVKIITDIEIAEATQIDANITIDLDGHTLKMTAEPIHNWGSDLRSAAYYITSDVTFKNGSIVVSNSTEYAKHGNFFVEVGKSLTFDNVDITTGGINAFALVQAYGPVNYINGTSVELNGKGRFMYSEESLSTVKIANSEITINGADGGLGHGLVLDADDSVITMTNINGNGLRNVSGTITNTILNIDGADSGIKNDAGLEITIDGTSNVTITGASEYDLNLGANDTIKVKEPAVLAVETNNAIANVTGDGTIVSKADALEVVFEFDEEDETYITYDIILKGISSETINRLNSADLTFALDQISGKNTYEIVDIANDNITFNPVYNPDDGSVYEGRYEFHFEDKDADVDNDTAASIAIAQVKFTGYGKFNFGVNSGASTNAAHATKIRDNIVDTFIPNGDDKTIIDGELVISNNISGEEIAVPTRNLVINVAFPNAVSENEKAYQQMTVTVTGPDYKEVLYLANGTEGEKSYGLQTDANGVVYYSTDNANSPEVEGLDLVLNTPYTVTVEGAGYRTAKYTVSMTEDKTLNFWNNVMDNDTYVEESASGVNKNAQKVTFLAGDIVKDNNINVYDLSAVVSYFGEINLSATNKADYAKYDLNRDGKIDSKDVAYVLVSWNN